MSHALLQVFQEFADELVQGDGQSVLMQGQDRIGQVRREPGLNVCHGDGKQPRSVDGLTQWPVKSVVTVDAEV